MAQQRCPEVANLYVSMDAVCEVVWERRNAMRMRLMRRRSKVGVAIDSAIYDLDFQGVPMRWASSLSRLEPRAADITVRTHGEIDSHPRRHPRSHS